MKRSKLHGIAHNYADSLSRGLSFVVPKHVLLTNVYAEAAVNPEGSVVLDLLNGQVKGAFPGGDLEYVAPLFSRGFPAFCAKHGVDHGDYRSCLVRFIAGRGGNSYIITVEDRAGLRTAREYDGRYGRRLTEMDHLGRVRPTRIIAPED